MARSRNLDRGEYPWNWKRISYRVKRLHGFRCERCGHPHVPAMPQRLRGHPFDLWHADWLLLQPHGVRRRWIIIPRNSLIGRLRRRGYSIGVPAREVKSAYTRCDGLCRHDSEPVKLRVLTVHHLNGDKSDCALWNLAALCQVCHLQVQAKVCWEQTFLLEHSEWMKWHLHRHRLWCQRHTVSPLH